jgi:hypothetical protein
MQICDGIFCAVRCSSVWWTVASETDLALEVMEAIPCGLVQVRRFWS